jgi:DNA-binding NtrC family response regulator
VSLDKHGLIRKYEYNISSMSKSILIVEDDVDLLEIYKEILELHKFNVETALNGEEGVKKYIEKKPSLVIMDGDMPILDGYEAFKQIKKIDNNVNVIIVTGFSEFEAKSQQAVKEGLMKVILKPLGIEQLLGLAEKYTEIKIKK